MLEIPKANKTTTGFLKWNERDGYESRKNLLDEGEVKSPALFLMENQQPRPKGKVQRLSLGHRNMTIGVRLK